MRRFAAVVFVGFLVGCGGRVDQTSEPVVAADGDGGDGVDDPWAGAPLGACKLGHPVKAGEPCLWQSAGLCYSSKHDACNCACPRDHDSICFSDYPEDGSPVEVSCF